MGEGNGGEAMGVKRDRGCVCEIDIPIIFEPETVCPLPKFKFPGRLCGAADYRWRRTGGIYIG